MNNRVTERRIRRELDGNTLDFVERQSIASAIIKLCGSLRFMCGDGLSMFNRSTVLKVSGDAGSAKGVASYAFNADAAGQCAALDHAEHVVCTTEFRWLDQRPMLYRNEAGVVKLVDARHSKCRSFKECRFKSDRPHHAANGPRQSSSVADASKNFRLRSQSWTSRRVRELPMT